MALLTLSAQQHIHPIGVVAVFYAQSDPIYAQSEPIYAHSKPIYAQSEPIYA